jgi:hypothetical protein
MSRDDLVDQVSEVLVAHDEQGGGLFCICGRALHATNGLNGKGATSMRRHRAEMIVDALGLDLNV